MNLPKNVESPFGLPSTDEIKSLIDDSSSFKTAEFNKKAMRAMEVWRSNADNYTRAHSSNSPVKQEMVLKIWQRTKEPIAQRVLVKTGSLEIVQEKSENERVGVPTILDLGMTTLNNTVGLAFITGGNWSDEVNEALYIPNSFLRCVEVASHLHISNPEA